MDPIGLRARELRRGRPLAHGDSGEAIDASGTLFDGTAVPWRRGSAEGHPCASGVLRHDAVRKASDVRHRPRRGLLRRAGHPQDRSRSGPQTTTASRPSSWVSSTARHSATGKHHDHHEESAGATNVSTRHGRDRRPAAARCDDSVADGPVTDGRQPGAPSRVRLRADGLAHHDVDASRRGGGAERAVADAQPAGARDEARDGAQQHGAEERVPRHARHVERVIPERRQSEVDRKQRLLSGHDRRSNRREADGAGDAAALARAGDGSDGSGGAVRQRLRLRVPEQPLVVVTHDSAAVRGASTRRLRAPLRRRRKLRRTPRGARQAREPARLGARRHRAPAGPAWRGRSHKGRPVSRDRSRGRAAHSEGRSADAG